MHLVTPPDPDICNFEHLNSNLLSCHLQFTKIISPRYSGSGLDLIPQPRPLIHGSPNILRVHWIKEINKMGERELSPAVWGLGCQPILSWVSKMKSIFWD